MEAQDPGSLVGLLWLLIPLILAYLNTYLFSGLKALMTGLDKLPAIVQRIIYTVIQYGLLKLSLLVGMPLPEALEGFTPEILLALTSAVVGMGMHRATKSIAQAKSP